MSWQSERARLLGEAPPVLACLILGCKVPAVDVAYCAEHRVMADDGTLWLRCIFDGGHMPVAPNDLLACAEHRAAMEDL